MRELLNGGLTIIGCIDAEARKENFEGKLNQLGSLDRCNFRIL